MNYTIGIYSDEYLALMELVGKIHREIPEAEVKIFCGEKLSEEFAGSFTDDITSDLNDLANVDIAVLLSSLPDAESFAGRFGGTVVDLSEEGFSADYDNVIFLADPLLAMLYEIASVNDNMNVVLGLPVSVYGREGVDMLMQETRSIYSFDDFTCDILPMRLAFNVHFYKDKLPNGKLESSIELLRKSANSVSIRINPVSTVFVADMYAPETIEMPEELETFEVSVDFSLEDVSQNERIAKISSDNGRLVTLVGDYLHLKTNSLINAIRSLMGGAEQ